MTDSEVDIVIRTINMLVRAHVMKDKAEQLKISTAFEDKAIEELNEVLRVTLLQAT